MALRLLFLFCLVLLLSGCASTHKKSSDQVQQLQGRISLLESELQKKDQEISSLEGGLRKTQGFSSGSYKSKTGSSSEAPLSVRQIQAALKNAGYYKGAVDGQMGPKTREAIRAFQKARGLKADGIIGRKTSQELRNYLSH
ncbi:MAG: peptidoglycan-binding domain-containing protein [Candidatus Omnitrophota bacterium]